MLKEKNQQNYQKTSCVVCRVRSKIKEMMMCIILLESNQHM